MEFAGALTAELALLKHEILHSYIGRCVSPANGDAAWFDEAVAAWDDDGAKALAKEPDYSGGFLAKSHFDRRMITRVVHNSGFEELVAYEKGRKVIGYLDHLLSERGGMDAFLHHLLAVKRWTPVTNDDLVSLLNEFRPGVGNELDRLVLVRPKSE